MKSYENMPQITPEEVKEGLEVCTGQILRVLPEFTDKFQSPASENLFYRQIENVDWTNAFWTGEIWLAYEFSKEECLKEAALRQCDSFYERITKRIAVDSHDMGFLYSLSCVAAYKLTGNEKAKEAALMAADNLLTMFRTKGNFIQSINQPENKKEYRMIVDTLLNLPLLYWASEVTGDDKYKKVAITHFHTTSKYIIREDGSTAQAARFDNETGEHLCNFTRQGYSDDSAWSRGQAWAIYGPAISYKYTKTEACKEMFGITAPYFMKHLPEDMVAYFDLTFMEGDEWPRDSSAAAIAACGMLEMAKYLEQEEAEYYVSSAKRILKSLYDNYMVRDYELSNGILKHATYCCKTSYNAMSRDLGRDECCSFGDYFYMEALTRLHQDWEMYW
ncbi:MAG: glycoside hydrolase family 88 protein [Lachnospiraceae bacterium]|nr:glycoside hydrolase family 88 protein [Lachnospiraceae bacterium]